MENVLLGNVVDLAVSDPNMCVFRAMICRSCSAGTVCLFALPFTGVSCYRWVASCPTLPKEYLLYQLRKHVEVTFSGGYPGPQWRNIQRWRVKWSTSWITMRRQLSLLCQSLRGHHSQVSLTVIQANCTGKFWRISNRHEMTWWRGSAEEITILSHSD